MTLNIHRNTTIEKVKDNFSQLFPYLKIEFFTRPHEVDGAIWSKYLIFDSNRTLGEIGQLETDENTIEISPSMTVGDFEQHLKNKFGLFVQVFRQSMGTWVATMDSDSWTFETQNEQGREASTNLSNITHIAQSDREK